MNISKAFTYIFEDKDWVSKVIVGGVMLFLSLTVILAPFVAGYILNVTRNAMKGEKDLLPKWENWGNLYSEGLKLILIMIVYMIIFSVLERGLQAIPVVRWLTIVLSMVEWFYLPVVVLFYAAGKGDIKDAFELEKIFIFIKENFIDLLIILIINLILVPIAMIGLVGLILGVFFTIFYTLLVRAYLFGDLYRVKAKKNIL